VVTVRVRGRGWMGGGGRSWVVTVLVRGRGWTGGLGSRGLRLVGIAGLVWVGCWFVGLVGIVCLFVVFVWVDGWRAEGGLLGFGLWGGAEETRCQIHGGERRTCLRGGGDRWSNRR